MNTRSILTILFISATFQAVAQMPDVSLVPYRQGDKWGYAAPDRSVVISPQFEDAAFFYEGYAAVKKGGKYGYINKAGKLVIPYKFFVAKPFQCGYVEDVKRKKDDTVLFAAASLQASGYEICINTNGDRMPKCPAINENSEPGNNLPANNSKEKTYGIVANGDLYDKILDDYKPAGSEDHFYIATKNGAYGVFNNKFEVVVPFIYSLLTPVNFNGEVYLQMVRDTKIGILHGNGSPFIEAAYTNIGYWNIKNKLAYFTETKEGKTGVVDTANVQVIPAIYNSVEYDSEGGFVLTGADGLKGFYFLSGVNVPVIYKEVKLLNGGEYLRVIDQAGKKGFINNKGENFFTD